MFIPASLSGKRQAAKTLFSLFFALCLGALPILVPGCNMDLESGEAADAGSGGSTGGGSGGSGLTDTGNGETVYDVPDLNPGLISTWSKDFGGGYVDTYIITADNKITHPSSFGNALTNAGIAYVYNFSDTAECLIVRRDTDGKFTAVYYKDLTADSIIIGDAIAREGGGYIYPTADSLEEAKIKFAPANRPTYGGNLTSVSPIFKVKG